MAMEIEVKLKVDDFDSVRQRLRQIGGEFSGNVLETNRFFDREDRSLLNSDRGLRLRSNRDANGGGEKHVITWKGPRQAGEFKSREEIEVGVDDAQHAIALLGKLGYAQRISFEKRRESWKVQGCKVELDELPRLGFFVEIEGESQDQIRRVRELLQLQNAKIVDTPYVGMIAQLNEKNVKF